jgi:hypothetical protein
MPRRYDRPAPKPPTIDDLPRLLFDARPTLRQSIEQPGETEQRRTEAVRALLMLGREAVAKADASDPQPAGYRRLRAMPPELREFLEIEGLRILLDPDPEEALQRLLGQQRRGRGRPRADNEARDILIAADVAGLVEGGATVDQACRQIGSAAFLSPEMVQEIYYARRSTNNVLLARLRLSDFDRSDAELSRE